MFTNLTEKMRSAYSANTPKEWNIACPCHFLTKKTLDERVYILLRGNWTYYLLNSIPHLYHYTTPDINDKLSF